MRKILIITLLNCVALVHASKNEITFSKEHHKTLKHASAQLMRLQQTMHNIPDSLPRNFDKSGKLVLATSDWWTSGFFPGSLWYVYENYPSKKTKQAAISMTERVRSQQYTTNNHDVGFMIFCSFGNALRLTNEKDYEKVIVNAAKSLSTRFSKINGTIKSWDNNKWNYPVIIDNMMNLELLTQATKISGDSTFYKIAISHADTTLKYHYRKDGSAYHVVDYHSNQQGFIARGNHQGSHDDSAWSRGQAWGFYGFIMMHRETKKPEYLHHSIKIANFLYEQIKIANNKIPYWDFNAPNIPHELRDASAAAIIASAMLELGSLCNNNQLKSKFHFLAFEIINTLSTEDYLAKKHRNGNFVLKHSVGFMHKNSEVDVPLTYADYYFMEALTRLKNMYSKK